MNTPLPALGIDVSKHTLEVALLRADHPLVRDDHPPVTPMPLRHESFENTPSGFERLQR